MATLTAADLLNKMNAPKADSADPDAKGVFKAENLTVQVFDSAGEMIAESKMEARAFKAKLDKRSGKVQGGCGWYSATAEGDYNGLPLDVGLRISLKGVKIGPTDVVDFSKDSTKE